MDDLSERRRPRDKGFYLLDVLSLRRIRYLGSPRIFGERTVRLGEHDTVAGRVATFVNEIRMGIERRREARRVRSPCVTESIHIEVGDAGAQTVVLNPVGTDVAEDREQMERLAAEVIPALT